MEEKENKKKLNILFPGLGATIGLLLGLVIFQGFFSSNESPSTALAVAGTQSNAQESEQLNTLELEQDQLSDVIDPTQFLSREQYFREAFKPKRSEYRLFKKAAEFLGKPVEQMPDFFFLRNESEIFELLPSIPKDFSEIAYATAGGKYFNIGSLEESYYKQPEFYPNFKTFGIRYWTRPDPKYWTPHGYGVYPGEQFDTLTIGGRDEFVASVFVYTGWGVQTFQGVKLRADSESEKYFDMKITPNTFLLEPSFPKFQKNWAYKVDITGKLKNGTPAETYNIAINLEVPEKEIKDVWIAQHPNLYFDAVLAIKPSGNLIDLVITVQEATKEK